MKRKKRISIPEIVAILSFVFIVIILLIPVNRSEKTLFRPPAVQTNSVESSRTLQEMQGFMNTHLATLITETFPNRQFRFPEIQKRYDLLAEKIQQRYGKGYVLSPVSKYHPSSKLVSTAAGIENQTPTITLFMPSLMDLWDTMEQKLNGREETFKLLFVIDWIHELDHLAGGDVPEEGEKNYPFEKRMENEKRTWAETCEHTIRPLIEKYKLPLSPRERTYYLVWVQSGRDVNSSAWGSFIRGQYEKVRL